jgi:hypothetical protein
MCPAVATAAQSAWRANQCVFIEAELHSCRTCATRGHISTIRRVLRTSAPGVVAKRCDRRYLPRQREWVKVKRRHSADCVVIGVAGDHAHPWLVLGLRRDDGLVHHVGLARLSVAVRSGPVKVAGLCTSIHGKSYFSKRVRFNGVWRLVRLGGDARWSSTALRVWSN